MYCINQMGGTYWMRLPTDAIMELDQRICLPLIGRYLTKVCWERVCKIVLIRYG